MRYLSEWKRGSVATRLREPDSSRTVREIIRAICVRMKMMPSIYQRFACCTRPTLRRRTRRFFRPRVAPIGEHYPLVGVSGIQLSHHQSTNRERTNREAEKRSRSFVDRVRHVWPPCSTVNKGKGDRNRVEFYPVLRS